MNSKQILKRKSTSINSSNITKRIFCQHPFNDNYYQRPSSKSNLILANHHLINSSNVRITTKKNAFSLRQQPAPNHHLANLQDTKHLKQSTGKNSESESTADDWMAKVAKSRSIQDGRLDRIRNSLLAISKKNQQQQFNIDKQTINYEVTRTQNKASKKKIPKCKIIKNPAIPFLFPKKSSTHKKIQSLIADTQNISMIEILPDQFISPQSQQFIQEL